ncbi:MAG: hypothetical protein HLUCCO02_06120 [Idiomarinaceae bacterium HL-53]|nr:MAG: hypothetical protein HLUCCO02_06120 [Idiomarinaceae bacterium HL-53]CUS48131.1 hypothetical protein Ga0003345_1070 [Idiomarinaceae bacterium HL-53]
MKKRIVIMWVIYGAFAFTAKAQDAGGETLPSLVEKLQTCRGIDNAIERLVCFDNIVAALPAPESIAPTPMTEGSLNEEDDETQFLDIVEMWQDNRDYWHFKLRNGEVWRQTEFERGFPIESGRKYYIQKGFFNSHFLRTPGLNRRIRVVQEN